MAQRLTALGVLPRTQVRLQYPSNSSTPCGSRSRSSCLFCTLWTPSKHVVYAYDRQNSLGREPHLLSTPYVRKWSTEEGVCSLPKAPQLMVLEVCLASRTPTSWPGSRPPRSPCLMYSPRHWRGPQASSAALA